MHLIYLDFNAVKPKLINKKKFNVLKKNKFFFQILLNNSHSVNWKG